MDEKAYRKKVQPQEIGKMLHRISQQVILCGACLCVRRAMNKRGYAGRQDASAKKSNCMKLW